MESKTRTLLVRLCGGLSAFCCPHHGWQGNGNVYLATVYRYLDDHILKISGAYALQHVMSLYLITGLAHSARVERPRTPFCSFEFGATPIADRRSNHYSRIDRYAI